MRFKAILITLLLCAGTFVSAQHTKVGPVLEYFLSKNETTATMVDLFVHGNAQEIKSFTRQHDGIYKRSVKNISAIRISSAHVRELATQEFVDGFEFSMTPGYALNDSMRVNNNSSRAGERWNR